MTTKIFRVVSYKYVLGAKQPFGTTTFPACLACYGSNKEQLVFYFCYEGDTRVSNMTELSGRVLGRICIPISNMDLYIDMVRNETPVYAYLNDQKPDWSCIKTSDEPVGEEES